MLLSLMTVIVISFNIGHSLGTGTRRAGGSRGFSSLIPFRGGLPGTLNDREGDPNVPPDQVFEDVLDKVQHEFVEGGGTNTKITTGALTRMLASLDDPKTGYLDQEARQNRLEALRGRFHGIGALLTVTKTKTQDIEYRHLTIVDVMPGSPAQRAGLRTGDYLTHINGHWIISYSISVDADKIRDDKNDDQTKESEIKSVSSRFRKGYNLSKALDLLVRGEAKPIELTVERAGRSNPFSIEMKTSVTEVEPAEFKIINGKVAYLRIRQFNASATQTFNHALDTLPAGLTGFILDLRGNPGGVRAEDLHAIDGYASVRKLISRLSAGGNVAIVARRPNQREPLTIQGSKPQINLPKYILIDHGTANLAELAVSALRDFGGAKIIGSRSNGDNVLQLLTIFKSGGGVEISSAHLFTASGMDLKQGVKPDFQVEDSVPNGAYKLALSKCGVGV